MLISKLYNMLLYAIHTYNNIQTCSTKRLIIIETCRSPLVSIRLIKVLWICAILWSSWKMVKGVSCPCFPLFLMRLIRDTNSVCEESTQGLKVVYGLCLGSPKMDGEATPGHNRSFFGNGLVIARYSLLSNKWVKSICLRVAYGQTTYAQASSPYLREGFRKWEQRDFRKRVWKLDLVRDWKP